MPLPNEEPLPPYEPPPPSYDGSDAPTAAATNGRSDHLDDDEELDHSSDHQSDHADTGSTIESFEELRVRAQGVLASRHRPRGWRRFFRPWYIPFLFQCTRHPSSVLLVHILAPPSP